MACGTFPPLAPNPWRRKPSEAGALGNTWCHEATLEPYAAVTWSKGAPQHLDLFEQLLVFNSLCGKFLLQPLILGLERPDLLQERLHPFNGL